MIGAPAFAGLSAASASATASTLREVGDGLRAQCHGLQERPDPHACAQLALNLEGARQTVLRLREALLARDAG